MLPGPAPPHFGLHLAHNSRRRNIERPAPGILNVTVLDVLVSAGLVQAATDHCNKH